MAAKKATTKPSKASSKPTKTAASAASSKSATAKSKPKTSAKPKTTSKAKVKPKATTKPKAVAKSKSVSKPKAKATSKKPVAPKTKSKTTVKKSASTSKAVDFITDVLKQAAKAQKAAQNQTKALIKTLNGLDKQHAQLVKKQTNAKGKSWQTLDGQINKLKTQVVATRTALLNSENTEDKIATIAEFVTQLNSRATPSTYLAAATKPSLVKNTSAPLASKSTGTSKPKQDVYLDEDDYPDEEDLDIDADEEEEMGFVFGEEDDLQDDEMGR